MPSKKERAQLADGALITAMLSPGSPCLNYVPGSHKQTLITHLNAEVLPGVPRDADVVEPPHRVQLEDDLHRGVLVLPADPSGG